MRRQEARELNGFTEDEIYLVSSDKIEMGSNAESNSFSGQILNQKTYNNNYNGRNEIATIREENYTTFSKLAEIPSIKIVDGLTTSEKDTPRL